ncbi:PHP domain-containing protein [Clostridium thermobutyricum]|uniref:PHP domain-containing protein n=1 Tax=Clostridium thermobutyricum TaxID=29372 RepID=UPI00294293C4|nr:PHP domain-containing protein [Clostridium thermobutyricum]
MLKSDFHVHTTSSDGVLSPTEVVRRAAKNGVKYLAITDHDTVLGIDEALKEAKKYSITIIPGIELSTNFKNESIHVLGFFKDESYKNPELIEILNEIKTRRIKRAKEMVKKLEEHFKIKISFDNVLKRGKDVVARPHIAKEIIDSGYDYSFDHIFDNFIGKDMPAYVPTNKLSTEDGVKLLHKFNAIAILAHPVLIKNSNIEEFLPFKLDGIEAIYYQNKSEDEKHFLEFAKMHNLLITAGSDCHGDFKNDARHGDIGDMKLPEKDLEKILNILNLL